MYAEFRASECHKAPRYEAPACLAAISRTLQQKRAAEQTFLACLELVELMSTWAPAR